MSNVNTNQILGSIANQQHAYMEQVMAAHRNREEAVLAMLAEDPRGTLSALGIEPPSRAGSVLAKAAVWGGAGAALGLGASLIPGVGPVVAAIAGGIGAVVGGAIGWFNHDEESARYDLKVRFVQHQAELMLRHVRNEETGQAPAARHDIAELVTKTFDRHDADGDGSITVADATGDGADLVRWADSIANRDGVTTMQELQTGLVSHDIDGNGVLTSLELLTLRAKLMSEAIDAGTVSEKDLKLPAEKDPKQEPVEGTATDASTADSSGDADDDNGGKVPEPDASQSAA